MSVNVQTENLDAQMRGAEIIRIARKLGVNEIDLAGELQELNEMVKTQAEKRGAYKAIEWLVDTVNGEHGVYEKLAIDHYKQLYDKRDTPTVSKGEKL